MMKGISLIKILVTLSLIFSITAKADTIVLATVDYPPYYGKTLERQGFISEIISTAFKRSGHKTETLFLPWQRAFDGTKSGKYTALYTVWYREDREQWFAYSDPLTPNEIGFLKRVDSDITFNEFTDLKDYKIGTVKGYSTPSGFEEAELNTESVAEDRINILKLLRNRIDLVLIDKINGQHILNTEHSDRKDEVEWLVSVQTDPQYLVFSRKDPDFEQKLSDFNDGLKAITDDGTLDKIIASHGF